MTNATTFKIDNKTYTTSGNGYYHLIIDNKKTRIKEAEFDEAYAIAMDQALKMVGVTADEPLSEEYVEEATEAVSLAMENEAVLEAAKEAQGQEKPKRKAKKRTPKDVEYRNTINNIEITLTEKQLDFLFHLPDTCYWENGIDSAIWVDCLCDEIGGQFAGKPMTVGAMISTICEKGLGVRGKDRMNGKKCTSFALTELGKEVMRDLGF